MLKYRINTRKFNKTKTIIDIDNITFTDFNEMFNDEIDGEFVYEGFNSNNLMLTCNCNNVDKLENDSIINTVNTLFLNYDSSELFELETYRIYGNYRVFNVNKDNESFSFIIDKFYHYDNIERVSSGQNNENNVIFYFNDIHYFDKTDYKILSHYVNINDGNIVINEEEYNNLTIDEQDNYLPVFKQKIPIYFRYTNIYGEPVVETIYFDFFSSNALITSYDSFETQEQKNLYRLIFNSDIDSDRINNNFRYVNRNDEDDKLTEEEYNLIPESEKTTYIINETEIFGDLSGIDVYRDNFLFGEKTNFEISFDKPTIELKIPITNTLETNLYQIDLLNQYVDNEKNNSINNIVDIEKDVYYPCISNIEKNTFTDVYTIKFNLHFREHRGDDWLVENESMWNCIEQDFDNDKKPIKGTAKITELETETQSFKMTDSNFSDLLCFLNFTNDDVRFQRNKLKKSFLRISYYDSTNPANQNLIGYSTIFFDCGRMFSNYSKFFDENIYSVINYNRNDYGTYNITKKLKKGIRVDREYLKMYYKCDYYPYDEISVEEYNTLTDFQKQGFVEKVEMNMDTNRRLSTQFVVSSKNISNTSSEGFYIYIWKDNDSTLPQDLYMKIEFNHAGYGRTIPFMMPYWDKKRWNNNENHKGIKTIDEIIDDWNSEKILQNGVIKWKNGNKYTDGHYNYRLYDKFSYIHLKYQYDKTSDKHIYYLDPDIYDSSVTSQDTNEIEINLYEAKIGD